MTTTLIPSLFDFKKLDPFAVGYDKFFSDLEDLAKTASKNLPSYPPYNIKAVGKDKYVIEMAVAGFAKTDIEVSLQGNKLTVQGSTQDEDTNETQDYIFKGIANRNFTRTFNLADKIEIKDAEIVNGMLKIWLDSLVETQANIKKIAIK
jgi:molecular chaperone IbpA